MKNSVTYSTDSLFFSLSYRMKEEETIMNMQVLEKYILTNFLPHTSAFLTAHSPAVLETKCFNEGNLPFSEEVKQTELGHLFEHILLVQLCEVTHELKSHGSVYNGITSWNWRKNRLGSFTITISIGKKQFDIFVKALKRACNILNRLFQFHVQPVLKPDSYASNYLAEGTSSMLLHHVPVAVPSFSAHSA